MPHKFRLGENVGLVRRTSRHTRRPVTTKLFTCLIGLIGLHIKSPAEPRERLSQEADSGQ